MTPTKTDMPERIWIEPKCCADKDQGQLWCDENVWHHNCENKQEATEYVLAAKLEEMQQKLDMYNRAFQEQCEVSIKLCTQIEVAETGLKHGWEILEFGHGTFERKIIAAKKVLSETLANFKQEG